ncbi:MAG: isochorismatase family protein [Thermoplasmatota archaeon]
MSMQSDPKQTQKKVKHNQNNKTVFRPQTSSLFVIDMQQFFCNPSSHAYLKDSKKIIPNIQQLITIYRQQSLPVIFTRYALLQTESPGAMGRWWNDVLYDDDDFSNVISPLQPLPNELVIRKTQYSAFFETDLDQILKKLKVTTILITGVLTHLCCETTARDAFMRNYDVFFLTDATASDKQDLHNASLRTLSDGFATLVTTNEVLSWIKEMK